MKQKYILTFHREIIDTPLTYDLIKKYDIKVNILRAEISGDQGQLLVELNGSETAIEQGLNYLNRQNVQVELLSKHVQHDAEKCVHCGSCTGVCFTGALTMDRTNWELIFKPEHCVACGLCVTACPMQLFKISLGE